MTDHRPHIEQCDRDALEDAVLADDDRTGLPPHAQHIEEPTPA